MLIMNVHPEASKNFDRKANELVSLVKELPVAQYDNAENFPSERYVMGYLSGNITNDGYRINYLQEILEMHFFVGNKRWGLSRQDCNELVQLAKSIQSSAILRDKLSHSFVEKTLFSWVELKFQGKNASESFIEYLNRQIKLSVELVTLWVPIANLEVEIPFYIAQSEIRPISKIVTQQWENRFSTSDEQEKLNVADLFRNISQKYQGLAAVVTTIEAEPKFAFEKAVEQAKLVVSVLAIFSVATLIPNIKCVCGIKGSEFISQSTVILEYESGKFGVNTSVTEKFKVVPWRLSRQEIMEIKPMLDQVSSLLTGDKLTNFKKSVLTSILLYSKSAFTTEPVEKIVYILSALESILLKNGNEPIQQNLAERLAIFVAQELPQRKFILKITREIYAIRSRYLHHGYSSSEFELVSEFMKNVFTFFMKLIDVVDKFNSKEEFIEKINDLKLT